MRLLSLLIFLCCSQLTFSQNAQLVKLDKLLGMMNEPSETLLVINFWATWCAPCVKELPLFEKLNEENLPGVKVLLVSMDLDLDANPDKVYKFIARKKMRAEVFILDEPDPNSWINKIEKNWSGALPATLLISQRTGKRKFVEKELHEGDLEKLIAEFQ